MLASESLLESKYLSKFGAIVEKVSCPICCVSFQGPHRPMVSCQNRHTICIKCMDLIINKALSATSEPSPALCPICRQRIQLPIQSNEEMREFLQLINMFDKIHRQAQFCDLYRSKVLRLEKEARQKEQEIRLLKKRCSSDESMIQLLRIRIDELNDRIRNLEKSLAANGENDDDSFNFSEKSQSLIKKLPLRALFDNLDNDTHLNLAMKDFSVPMLENLILYDMSHLVELNLNFNLLGDDGFYILMSRPYMPQLRSLKLSNNRISKLSSLRYFHELEQLIMSNFVLNISNSNRIGSSTVDMLFEHKWEKLKNFGIQFENDSLWEEDAFVTKFVEHFPVISKIELSQMNKRISKIRCQTIKNLINKKAKRPNNNRIMITQKNM